MSVWSARFGKESDSRLNDFNSSIYIDKRMYYQDIQGSIAHIKMLGKQGIISQHDAIQIQEGLLEIQKEIQIGNLEIDMEAEDIHMFIERELTQRIGENGKRLHTARSRNDQVVLDFRMYTMDAGKEIIVLIEEFIAVLLEKAKEHIESIMPGYTHLQKAQPITFAHHLMAYVEMFIRDRIRLQNAITSCNSMPLGSGALATTTYPIDREYVREVLGFEKICRNSLDAVSDRDFAMEMAAALSIIMVHLSRFSEEIIFWSSWEFKFIELDDAFATGSSIMPQKKNPDICELIRGKSGRVFGNLQALFTMMKGLALAYNKDMQEDKEALFDSLDTVKLCLTTIIPMVESMRVLVENMRLAAAKGFLNATDCADYLTKKGLPFREAYQIIGKLVAYAIERKKGLEEISLQEYQKFSPYFKEDIYLAIHLETCVKGRNVLGGPAPERVWEHIKKVEKELFPSHKVSGK